MRIHHDAENTQSFGDLSSKTGTGDSPTVQSRFDRDTETRDGTGVPSKICDVVIPGYIVEEEIARGGMGVVYLAWQTNLCRQTAIKMLTASNSDDTKYRLRFMAEAEATASLRHPNIANVFDFGVYNDKPYLAMEYCSGGTLTDMLRSKERLGIRETVELMTKLANAVQTAHDQQIIHRDIKPGNILFTQDGEPKLVDFGLAKRNGVSDLTQTQAILGTPAYMAPEQARGDTKFVGPGADIYALGVVLYECLTGKRPFEDADTLSLLRMVSEMDPKPPRSIVSLPRDLELICLKCLEKNAINRYQSASSLAADLVAFQKGEAVSARPLPVVEQVIRWTRRRPARATAVGLVALAGLFFFIYTGVANKQLRAALKVARDQTLVAEAKDLELRNQQEKAIEDYQSRIKDSESFFFSLGERLRTTSTQLAKEFFENVLDLNEKQLIESPKNHELMTKMADRYKKLGLLYSDEASKKRKHLSRSQQLFEASLEGGESSKSNDHLAEFADLQLEMAKLEELQGNYEAAHKYFVNAANIFDRSFTSKPDVESKIKAINARRLASEQLAHGDSPQTIESEIAKLIDEYRSLLESNLGNKLLLESLSESCHSMAILLAEKDYSKSQEYFDLALNYRRTLAQKEKNNGISELITIHNDYKQLAVQNQDHAKLAKLAEVYFEDCKRDFDGPYYAAMRLCRAYEMVKDNQSLVEAQQVYLDRIIYYLNRTVDFGFVQEGWYALDWELDPVRETDAYKKFALKLRVMHADDPLTLTKLVDSLIQMYGDTGFKSDYDKKTFQSQYRSKRTFMERDWYWNKAIDLLKEYPGDEYGVYTIRWLIVYIKFYEKGEKADELLARVIRHAKQLTHHDDFATLATELREYYRIDAIDQVLIHAYANTTNQQKKASYLQSLGYAFIGRAQISPFRSAEQLRLYKDAKRIYELLKSKYGTLRADKDTTNAESAEKYLSRIESYAYGSIAPDFTGETFAGETLSLSDYRGKVVLVEFWASWCPPCMRMIPDMIQLHKDYQQQDFAVIGINVDSVASHKNVREILAKHQIEWPSIIDAEDEIFMKWSQGSIPFLAVLTKEGRIYKTFEGAGDETTSGLKKAIDECLAISPETN